METLRIPKKNQARRDGASLAWRLFAQMNAGFEATQGLKHETRDARLIRL
jgi:hypothetical protein